jgi:rod shape-determining protein MreD
MMVFGFVLQSTTIEYVEIFNSKPNIILVFAILYALIRGYNEGATVGFFSGLILDVISGKVFGLNALLFMYTCILVGKFNKTFFKDSYFVAILFTSVFTLIYQSVFYFLNYFIWGQTNLIFVYFNIIIPEVIYNSIVAIPIYAIMIRLNNKIEGVNPGRY